jgi:hypothetical protein
MITRKGRCRTPQSNWPYLSDAHDLLDSSDGSVAAAFDIIGHGQVPITAYRSDTPESMNQLPERVETLLASARPCLVDFPRSDIYAFFNGQTERSLVRFFGARVHLPSLVDALAAVGYIVADIEPDPTHSQRRRRAKRRSGPTPTADKIRKAGEALMKEGHVPAETVQWEQFRKLLCNELGVKVGARGYSVDTIQAALRPILNKRRTKGAGNTEN